MRKTVLITGASAGLGAGMARAFAARGRNLALCARRTERLSELKTELEGEYPDCRVSIAALDVNDHDRVFEVFDGFAEAFGGLDRVIERERPEACVPPWPWTLIGFMMRLLPLRLVARMA